MQCDKCELWYHLYCIGLKPHNIKEDEDFCCRCFHKLATRETLMKLSLTWFMCCRNCKQPSGKGGKGGSGSDMDTD